MYLSMLKEQSAKRLFLKYAALMSFVDVLEDASDGMNFEETFGDVDYFPSWGDFHDDIIEYSHENEEMVKKTLEVFVARDVEIKMLEMFCDETGISFEDGQPCDERRREIFAEILFGTAALIQKVAQTTNQDLLRDPKIRQLFILQSCKAFADYNHETIESLTPEERRVMVFELLGMAYSDGVVTDQEQEVVSEIAKLLGVDELFLDDAREIIEEIACIQKKGLELIEE